MWYPLFLAIPNWADSYALCGAANGWIGFNVIKLALLHKLLLLLLLEVGATGCRVADAVIEATAKSAEFTPELIPYWLTTDCSYREYMLM